MKPAHLRRANALLDARSGLQYALTRVSLNNALAHNAVPISINCLDAVQVPRDVACWLLRAVTQEIDERLAELGVDTSDLQGA